MSALNRFKFIIYDVADGQRMVDDSQVDILEDWDKSTETQKKKHIKERLGSDLIELRHFLKMTPHEAQDAVQNAIDDHIEEEYDHTTDRKEIEKELARQIISALFNGFSEEAFNYGFNSGVSYTLHWRSSSGDLHGSWLQNHLRSSKDFKIVESNSSPHENEYDSPPDDEWERRKRILLLEDKGSVLSSGVVEKILNEDVDPIDENESYEPVATRDDSPTREDFRPVQEFHHAVKIGRERALKFCFKINHPNNLAGNLNDDWFVRETIELHREFLNEQGQLPDEEDLPEYGDPQRAVRDPSKLNLAEWEYTSKKDN